MRKNAWISFWLTVLALPGAARAAGSAGAEPFNFLFLDSNARPVAMGGAYTALALDANALHYNPAGLGRVRRDQAAFMHNSFFEGLSQEYIGYASRHGWGAQVNMLRAGEIERTTIGDKNGTTLGHATFSDLALGAGYGRALTEELAVGAGLKMVRETIDDVSASAYALDLGGLYTPPGVTGMTLAISIANIGPTVSYQAARENLPINVRLGGAYRFDLLGHAQTAALDLAKTRSEDPLLAFGFETLVHPQLALRLGFNTRNDAGPGVSVGFGTGLRDFDFDYAFVPYGQLGAAHRIGLGLRWGEGGGEEALRRTQTRVWTLANVFKQPDVKASSKTITGYFENADSFVILGLYHEAKEHLEMAKALLHFGDHRRALYYERLGRIQFLEGDCSNAQTSFTESLRIAIPSGLSASYVADAYLGIGRCLKKAQQYGKAEEFFRKALSAQPAPATRDAALDELKELGTAR